ncbi:MAG: hypothetical protein KDD51_04940 [Bdellovibrionales bacterium]|nr:hypothetical protein [Bdellovibrionales bacterium]
MALNDWYDGSKPNDYEVPWAYALVGLSVLLLMGSALGGIHGAVSTWAYQTALSTAKNENTRLKHRVARHDAVKAFLGNQAVNEEADIYGLLLSEIEVVERAAATEIARQPQVASFDVASTLLSDQRLQRQLTTMRKQAGTRRDLMAQLERGLGEAGFNTTIKLRQGEVIVHLAGSYFTRGSSRVTPRLAKNLQKVFSIYADHVFDHAAFKKNIAQIELVALGDKKDDLLDMDLGYQRSRSIYRSVFDTKKTKFKNQKDLMKLIKVSRIDYLEAQPSLQNKQETAANLCRHYGCEDPKKIVFKVHFKESGEAHAKP